MHPSAQPAPFADYRFGNRLVASNWHFAELPGHAGALPASIRIEAGDRVQSLPELSLTAVQQSGEQEAGQGMLLFALATGYLIRFPGLADFELRPDSQAIAMRALAGVDDNTLEHLLVDQVLPRYLAHEGELLIHASAVDIRGKTVLFLGESGWGKSTLAGLLHRAGHRLFSDDCVQVVRQDGRFRSWPTYPSLRLFADSLGHAFPDAEGLTAVAGYSSKQRLPIPATGDPAPIAALYLLDEPSDEYDRVEIAPMRPVSACLELMRHAFKLDVADRPRTQWLLSACSELARDVPAFSLDYPRDFAGSGQLVWAIANHAAGLPGITDKENADARR